MQTGDDLATEPVDADPQIKKIIDGWKSEQCSTCIIKRLSWQQWSDELLFDYLPVFFCDSHDVIEQRILVFFRSQKIDNTLLIYCRLCEVCNACFDDFSTN